MKKELMWLCATMAVLFAVTGIACTQTPAERFANAEKYAVEETWTSRQLEDLCKEAIENAGVEVDDICIQAGFLDNTPFITVYCQSQGRYKEFSIETEGLAFLVISLESSADSLAWQPGCDLSETHAKLSGDKIVLY